MIISWEQVRQVVELFSEEHLMIKRFYSDFEDQMSTYSTLGEDFPVLYMTPVDGVMGYTQNRLNIRFYCFDRIIRDRSNINVIVSDTHRCLNDLYKFLQSPNVELIDTIDEASILPINDATMDYVSGWYMDIEISLDTYSDCYIMIDDVPVFSWGGSFNYRLGGAMSDKLSNIPVDGDNNIIIETGDNSSITLSTILIKINMIPVYDSNDDAKLDGLTEGFLYRTSNGDLKVVI